METPPHPFEALAHLTDGPDPITRARLIGEALTAIPQLQKWLRAERQREVRQANGDGMTYTEIGDQLGISKPRVSAIANNSPSGSGTGGPPGRPPKPPAGSP